MPQDDINFEGRRRGPRHNTCKANGQISGTGLVNGPVAPKAAATATSERTPAVTLNGSKLHCMVNGYINYGCKGKRTKAARKEGRRISAVTDAAAAGRVSVGGIPGGISVNGVTSLDTNAFAHNSDQMTLELSLPAATKNKRRRKKFRHKKRDTEVTCPEKCELLLLPPQEEENWENEIQDVTLTDWENMCFGVKPYGPEDVLHFALRDLTLKQRDTGDLAVTANYSPAVHHPHPVQWFCCSVPTEPGQFADAEDAVGPFSSARLQTAFSMVSPTMKAVVDAVWAVWSIGASIYDYIHTNAMEERIHALENVITIHQCVIGLLSAGVLVLFTYILFKKL